MNTTHPSLPPELLIVKELLQILYYTERLHRMGLISDTYEEQIKKQVKTHLDVFVRLWVKREEESAGEVTKDG